MQFSRFSSAAALVLVACSTQSSIKPAEVLDERTGMTVEELRKPIMLTQAANNFPTQGKHISFAYLGPVEWDRSGTPSYGLWVHVAPGNDWQFDSIRMQGTVTLVLDGAPVVLSTIDPPQLTHGAYQPIASWGQTAYFGADIPLLKRMAASQSIELDVKAEGGAPVRFAASPAARQALAGYVAAQGY
ncbi:MAG TPA: hypothetical protein VKT22_11845 [Steroidobacteraceae bacterium]|nr:hypothetical protein [Steroidobacteraceae bacterium]